MRSSRLRRLLAAAGCALGSLLAQPALANGYSDLVFFGDSLSDTGNLFLATGGAQLASPYFNGRASNGPLWTEVMAGLLGQPGDAQPYLVGGNNYAFAGARTGTDDTPPGVLAQAVGVWGASHASADPNALYVVVGGGNDMRDARRDFADMGSAADAASRQAAAVTAVTQLGQTVGYLASKGARNVLIANLPDLGFTPEAALLGKQAASSDASARFNALLPGLVATGNGMGLNMSFVDFAGIGSLVRLDAQFNGGGVFGITNVTTPCGPFAGSVGIDCDVSAFSDALHPTAKVHQIFGLYAAQAALRHAPSMPVPEPGTYAMMLVGLLGLAGARRRMRRG